MYENNLNFMVHGRPDIVCKLEFINIFNVVISFVVFFKSSDTLCNFFYKLNFLIVFHKTIFFLSKLYHSPLLQVPSPFWYPSPFYKCFCTFPLHGLFLESLIPLNKVGRRKLCKLQYLYFY